MERSESGCLALALLVLAGCTSPPPPDDVVWLAQEGRVWCYRTLATPDCFARPQAGAEARLIAIGPRRSFIPAPNPGEAPAASSAERGGGAAGSPISLGSPTVQPPSTR